MRLTTVQIARLLLTRGLPPLRRKLLGRQIDFLVKDYRQAGRLAERDRRVRARNIPRHARRRALAEDKARLAAATSRDRHARQLFDHLVDTALKLLRELDEQHRRHLRFRSALVIAATETERRQVILDFARQLGATARQLRGDRRALGRCFGEEAVTARYLRRRGERQLLLIFVLDRIGGLAPRVVRAMRAGNREGPDQGAAGDWQRLRVEAVVRKLLRADNDPRMRAAGLRCMRRVLRCCRRDGQRRAVDARLRDEILHLAQDATAETWIQCEALSLLDVVAPEALEEILEQRITARGEGPGEAALPGKDRLAASGGAPRDDMFVRRHIVRLLFESPRRRRLADRLFASAAADPSPFVRQQLAASVWKSGAEKTVQWAGHLMGEDDDPKVRAAAIAAFCEHAVPEHAPRLFSQLAACLRRETEPLVLRVALHVAAQWFDAFQDRAARRAVAGEGIGPSNGTVPARTSVEVERVYRREVLPAVERLRSDRQPTVVRRAAAQAGQRIAVLLDPPLRALLFQLRTRAASLSEGRGRRLPGRWLRQYDADSVGRVLAVMAQQDHGFDLERTWYGRRLVRGNVFGLRVWRILHEARRAAIDKRSGFRHTVGRLSRAQCRAPSQVMAEMSPTKVPGEPLYISEEGGWRPYLPLPDDLISALNISWRRPRYVRFYTSEGVTELAAPRRIGTRLRAAARLAIDVPRLARLRNWKDEHEGRPRDYVAAIEALGFDIRFRPYAALGGRSRGKAEADSGVLRFFAGAPLIALGAWQTWIADAAAAYVDYFGSAFENSMLQLLAFIIAALAVFLTCHFFASWMLGRARRRIPLAVGGWGTRGKSGTERLKAAMLAAEGYGLISKTTGCEAAIIQNDPFGEPLEIPLFRPYDRATIWEHQRVLELAAKMKVSAFLWECMGLIPEYVSILQRQWTRDDLATITNTYPDHEDLQGPAGHDVAHSIAHFVPRGARLLTTERQMTPILADACRRQKTTLRQIDWTAPALITDDLLDRFPYAEHPDNVALALAVAEELGIDRDVALKGMADHLVPDLGVLKTFPVATVGHCDVEFTNGMSANERFGCLGNWSRMGFDRHDPRRDPSVWVTTVVNNRADRITRTRMFAEILVDDLQADRHVMIGTNLRGLKRSIEQAWESRIGRVTLIERLDRPDVAKAMGTLDTMARQLRQPTSRQEIAAWLSVFSRGTLGEAAPPADQAQLWDRPDAFAEWLRSEGGTPEAVARARRWHESLLRAVREYRQLAQQIRNVTPETARALNARFRAQMRAWFFGKLVWIEDPRAPGDTVLRHLVEATPPGCRNRVMGLQNIKGTGLDLVYRFQQWEACHAACRAIKSLEPAAVEQGLQTLYEMPTYGRLGWHAIAAALETVRSAAPAERADLRLKIDAIANKLAAARGADEQPMGKDGKPVGGRLRRWTAAAARQWRDVNAAARRRQAADRIYRDLAAERIGPRQAVDQLRQLAQAQQDG